MTDEAMSPLRRRMIEDMTIRKLAPKTQQGYIRTIKDFAVFIGRSPDRASFEDVRRFQLHLAESGTDTPSRNHATSALRFFFRITLKQPAIIEHTHFIHEPRKLPVVLSPEEVARLLNAAPGLKYKAALSVAYGAGLRAAEVVSLKAPLADAQTFAAYLAPLRNTEWVVYAKRPFGGPAAVLAYLSRYTHRVAIANSRLIALEEAAVTFKWKDYRAEGRDRYKVMTLEAGEFIRRFLIHVLPAGFHRIRSYGLFANGARAENTPSIFSIAAAASNRPSARSAILAIAPLPNPNPHSAAPPSPY
jgi:Putative transposase/Phage integrase, N-terminal SAM-like domain